MYEIKKIKIWPFARSVALLFTVAMVVIPIGFVFFIAVVEGGSYGGGFDLEDFFDILFDEDFMVGYLILLPVTAGVSLATAALSAWAYNLVSERIGGIVLGIDYHQEDSTNVQDGKQQQNQ